MYIIYEICTKGPFLDDSWFLDFWELFPGPLSLGP